jgi:hypothetical protein
LLLPFSGFSLIHSLPPSRTRIARSGGEHCLQGARKFGSAHSQLSDAVPHKPAQQLFSSWSYVNVHLPAVPAGTFATKEAPFFHAVHQLNGAVVLDLQPFGQTANGGFLVRR